MVGWTYLQNGDLGVHSLLIYGGLIQRDVKDGRQVVRVAHPDHHRGLGLIYTVQPNHCQLVLNKTKHANKKKKIKLKQRGGKDQIRYHYSQNYKTNKTNKHKQATTRRVANL